MGHRFAAITEMVEDGMTRRTGAGRGRTSRITGAKELNSLRLPYPAVVSAEADVDAAEDCTKSLMCRFEHVALSVAEGRRS
jgi:hypothetical protein